MAKTIFEELGGRYERQGDYLIPCIALPAEEEQPIGTWGQRHLDYLKQYRKVTYTNLLTSGRLNAYLADIDKQAQERFILFLRECSDEAKPFYTVEVREQKAIQVRGMGDCGMTPEVAAFIADWEQRVLSAQPASAA